MLDEFFFLVLFKALIFHRVRESFTSKYTQKIVSMYNFSR